MTNAHTLKLAGSVLLVSSLACLVALTFAYAQTLSDGDVGDTGPSETVTFNATPSIITQGQSSSLSWNASGMMSCSIDRGIGPVSNTSGSRTVTPTQTTTYTIVCTGYSGIVWSASRTVTVNAPPPPQATLSASPMTAAQGSSSTLTYRCANSTSGSISPSIGAITADGTSRTVSTGPLTKSTQFRLTCTNSAGATSQAYVTVRVLWAELDADPMTVVLGSPTTLTWHSTDADYCTSQQFSTNGETAGTVAVSPTATTTYTITCTRNETSTGGSGTWQYHYTDYSDLACPINNPSGTNVFRTVPTCSTSNPVGTSCNPSTQNLCKRQRDASSEFGSGNCVLETKLYRCQNTDGGTVPAQSVTSSVTVGVTTQGQGVDLTAGAISPTEAGAGTPTIFYAPIVNQGVNTTNRGFPVLFQRATSAAGANTTDVGVYQMLELYGGARSNAALSVTLPTIGTWYLRACADKNSAAHAGVIAESNEANNCGPWTAINVVDPGVCVGCGDDSNYVTCSASSAQVTPGSTITYTATPFGSAGAPYTWTAQDGAVGFGNAATTSRTFTQVGTYHMEVRANGATRPASCPAVVVSLCPGTPSVDLTADQTRVNVGESTMLRWNQISAVSKNCRVVRATDGAVLRTMDSNSCIVPGGSVSTGAITTQTTFSMVCDGVTLDSVIINVPVEIKPF